MKNYPVNYCQNCGTPVESRFVFGLERPACPACGWIYFEDPKVAAGVLVEQDESVLLVQRLNEPQQGLWSLPAGFVDAHEDPASAAARECLEETGLTVEILHLVDVIAGREHEHGADIMIVYAARIVGGRLQAGDDAGAAGFFPKSALPGLAFRATKQVLTMDLKTD